MEWGFIIPGKPQGKERPRACMIHGRPTIYTPKNTKEYERRVAESFAFSQRHGDPIPKGVPVYVRIYAFFPVPKSASKTAREKMLQGEILPTGKPDVDNIVKIVLDGLNGMAFHDDAAVVRAEAVKLYGEIPETVVIINDECPLQGLPGSADGVPQLVPEVSGIFQGTGRDQEETEP